MSDPWSDPDRPDETESETSGIGPPSSTFPGVPDATPEQGVPTPDPTTVADTSITPPDGTAVMPTVPTLPEPGPFVAAPDDITTPAPPARPNYVIAQRVPWYRLPGARAWAAIVAFALIFLIVALVIWLSSRGDESDSVIIDGSSTTSSSIVETSTTIAETIVAPPTDVSTSTSLVPDTSTTEPATTTTTTDPPATTTTEATTTTTTVPPTTTTTTVPPPPEVVVPSANSTVSEIIQASPGLSDLDALISSVGFYSELNAIDVPFTFFAPSNDAITAAAALLPSDAEEVRALLRRHVTTTARYGSLELFARTDVTMLDGATLPINGTARTIDGAELIVVDKGGAATDQVLHVVDAVLLP